MQQANFESDEEAHFPDFSVWFRQTITDVYSRTIPDTIGFLCEALNITPPPQPSQPIQLTGNSGESLSKKRKIAEVAVAEESKVIPTKLRRKEAFKPPKVTFRTQ